MMPPSSMDPQDAAGPRAIEEIDLRRVLHVLWQYRLTVLVTALFTLIAAVAASVASTRYLAEGLFLTSGITLGDYKRYEVAMGNRMRLQLFLDDGGLEGSSVSELLHELAERPESMAAAVRPVFGLTERDAKAFSIKAEEGAGGLLGIQLTLAAKEQDKTEALLMLGEYLRSTMILVDLQDVMLNQCLVATARVLELRNEQLEAEFKIGQHQLMAENLRGIIRDNPRAETIDNRQVVSVEKGGERFLSPVAQLVAVEVSISDMKVESAKRERDRQAATMKKAYYCAAHDAAMEFGTGQKLLARLDEVQADVFKSQDLGEEIVEVSANELLIERTGWVSKYLQRSRFVVSPQGAERVVRRPSLFVAIVLGSLAGLLLGAFVALARAWWRRNRGAVMSSDADL